MGNSRGVKHTYFSVSFWDDEWICALKPLEKMLYLYLLTNPLTNIAGVYKITDRRICFDTGLSKKQIKEFMAKFQAAHKALRMDEYIVILNAPKHQVLENVKIFSGIVNCLLGVPPLYLQQLVRMNYKFDLKEVFDRLSIPYPYEKEAPPSVAPEVITAKTIVGQAANVGFFIDEDDAKSLLKKTDQSWFRNHSFISFVAIKIREHEKYGAKPIEEQRRIFRKVLLDADNYRQEYPSWLKKQEEKDCEYAQEEKRREMLSELKRCPPVQCECGAELDGDLRCPKCGRFYWLDEEKLKWMLCESLGSVSKEFHEHVRKTSEKAAGQ